MTNYEYFIFQVSNAWTARGNRTCDWLTLYISPVSPCSFFYHTSNISHLDQSSSSVTNFHLILFFPTKRKRNMTAATCIDIILAIILPPLGVFLKFGIRVPNSFIFFILFHILLYFFLIHFSCGWLIQVEFWICLLLTILGYIPGILYALYIITKWTSVFVSYHSLLSLSLSPLLLFYFYISYNHFF